MASEQPKVTQIYETYRLASTGTELEHVRLGDSRERQSPRGLSGRVDEALIHGDAQDRLHETAVEATIQDALRGAVA
ncbi:hypothetical protein [Haloarcula sp. 1CSR25-25]|uniref:hypothetical protein n=1 Tax=Haloarcula sp. 1CSR25-25 TaxID=2862545 RepID=UPI002894FBEC|nr:hypothetical protein [Haloarcula sp. 1CSR25-25]MDT3435904.1 hypothetical protein [Haloarcula sp. 1CSR25-25]